MRGTYHSLEARLYGISHLSELLAVRIPVLLRTKAKEKDEVVVRGLLLSEDCVARACAHLYRVF